MDRLAATLGDDFVWELGEASTTGRDPSREAYQPTVPAVAFLESGPLTEVERGRIAHGIAERIFGLRP